MTGQRFILQYLEDHEHVPGLPARASGWSSGRAPPHRVRRALPARRDRRTTRRSARVVEDRVAELVPRAAHVFVPPYAESPREFVSYGYDSRRSTGSPTASSQRRMQVLGLECPPAEELMPGPIATPEEARAAGAPV